MGRMGCLLTPFPLYWTLHLTSFCFDVIMNSMKVLLLDDDLDMCLLMQDTIHGFGVKDVTVCNTYDQVVALDKTILDYNVVFLDVNLGIGLKTGVDVFNWMTQMGYHNRVVFFTGHARSYPLLVNALTQPQVSLLEKPASIKAIKKVLYE